MDGWMMDGKLLRSLVLLLAGAKLIKIAYPSFGCFGFIWCAINHSDDLYFLC